MMNLPVLITAMPTPGIPHATAREASELTEGAAHTFDHLLPAQWPDVLPMPPPAATQTLGLQVLAPNYQPLYMQIPIRPDHEEGDILVLAAMEASEGYHFSFNQITPALPQPIDGYATVVASTLGMALIDQAVVILDLLRASGNRFAVALPTPLAYGDLLGYIRPLCDPVDLSLFVGQSLTPHPVGQDLVLADGLVIQALPHGCRPAARRTFAALLQAPGTWGAADQFPRPLLKAGICLLSEGRRFFLNKREYPGQPCEETAANCIGCPPGRMQLKVARPDAFANLSMHGHPCKGLACGLPIPPAPLGDREDNIAFFDLRPLGLKPLSHFQVGRVRHVHTVLRSLDVSPPQGYTLRDDDHRVEQGFVTTETGACLTVSLALRSPSPGPRKTGRQAEMREVIQTSTPIPPTAGRLRVNWQTWMPDQPLRSHRTGRGAALPGATEQPGAALRLSRALPMHCLGEPWAALEHGQLITFGLDGYLHRPGETLQHMLLSPTGWAADAEPVLGPGGRRFFCLSDGMPARVLLEPGANRETFRREICETFQYSLGNMSIVSTIPAITDYQHRGFSCLRLCLATEQISKIRVPPGRLQPRRTPFFIDARPILKGVLWRFAPGFRVDLDALIAEFSDEGPLGYSLVVEGGLPEHAPPHNWLQIHEGQTLTLTFCRDLLAEGEAAEESFDSDSESTSDEGSSDDDQTSPSADGPDTAPAHEDTGRTPGATPEPERPSAEPNVDGPARMWLDGSMQDALLEGKPTDTSAFLVDHRCRPYKLFSATAAALFGICSRGGLRLTAAIGVAQGSTNFRISGAAQALADAAFFRRSLASTPDICEYVPGHVGEIFNEAADRLARRGAACLACTFASPVHTLTLCHWMAPHGASLQWAALAIRKAQGDATLPSLSQHLGHDRWHAGLSLEQLIQPFLPGHLSTPTAATDCSPVSFLLRLNIVSYNTLSLGARGNHLQPRASHSQRRTLSSSSLNPDASLCNASCIPYAYLSLRSTLRTGAMSTVRLAAGYPRLSGTAALSGRMHQVSGGIAYSERLPCNFWECQVGPTSTYVQKRGHRECRIDMVGIPAAWATGTVRAWVDPSIHVALASLDHTATCVSVDLWLTAPLRSPGKSRQRLKASTLCDPAHAAQIQAAVASIPAVSWEVSAHAHAAIVVGHLQATLGALQQKVPRPTDFQRMMATAKAGKAPGPDQIPGEFLRGFAAPLGPALFPLWLKMALRGTESIGFKGGLAVKFWKGKGSQKDPASYRQILLLSCIAKCMHQAMRPALQELYVQTTPELQIGGKLGKSVVYGAHVVRSFLRWMRATHTTCFVLYTDISSAFYSVARQLVAKSTEAADTDGGISLDGISLPAEDLALLRAHACDRSALHQAGATPWLEGLAARLTEGTWFLLQQDAVPVITTRGSRPGSSWADLLFAFVVSRVLAKRDELVRCSCPASDVPEVPWDNVLTLAPCDPSAGTLRVEDLVWADDLATLRVCPNISRLPAGIAADVGALSDAFSEHGFKLSVGPSKTAVMAQPSGSGSRRIR
eukprot:s913_g6.t1